MPLTQFAVLPYIIAGIMVLSEGLGGFYWLVPAVVFSFIKAVLDAWVHGGLSEADFSLAEKIGKVVWGQKVSTDSIEAVLATDGHR